MGVRTRLLGFRIIWYSRRVMGEGMQDAMKNPRLNSRTVYLIVLFHVLLWTLVPAVVNRNLPLDTIEALAWGQAWLGS